MGRAYLSLGSNIDPVAHLDAAVAALAQRFGDVVLSSYWRTEAVGFSGPPFVNAAALIESDLEPEPLNDWLHALENRHGRDRSQPRFASRPLDIDLVFYDHRSLIGRDHLQLPRPEWRESFVLAPMAEIAGDFHHPQLPDCLAVLWRDARAAGADPGIRCAPPRRVSRG